MKQLTRSSLRQSAGFTLVELLVAIAIGLVIISSLVAMLSSNAGDSKTNDRTAEIITNGRFALSALRREIREARFQGLTLLAPDVVTSGQLGNNLTNECQDTGATTFSGAFVSNIRLGLWGYNDGNPFSGNCIPSSSFADGNDVLVVRHADTIPIADTSTLVANRLYLASSYERARLFRSNTAPVTVPTLPSLTQVYEVRAYAYYISPFTTSATESPKVPALYRVALQPDGTMARELVASGIEKMSLQYGVQSATNTATAVQYFNTLDGGGQTYPSVSTAVTSPWDNVVSVRINLLARSKDLEPGYLEAQSYDLGDRTYTVTDGYRRQLFSTVVQVRNPAHVSQ
jgi:type IV pilus assembly protein PilW